MRLIDISRRLQNGVPVWPGDTSFSYEISWPMEQSGSVNVGKLVMSVHTGTHIDAPFHFDNKGKKIIDLDLSSYVGPARVIDVSGNANICVDQLRAYNLEGIERLLLYTGSWQRDDLFPTQICYLHEEIAPYLAEKGVRLIGVDVPSVDPLDSKTLCAHHRLHQGNIHILEGLFLDHVEPGDYELIALPLPLSEADGSPVRAVLRTIE